jgi:LysR family transcriptional regulator, low CO2-responsive transcriptional regulator
MNYTLRQLHVFVKITNTKSITKAAQELHLSQPAVSIMMKNFQDHFDIPLTEVIGRKLYITEFGKEIAAAAENIIHEVNSITHKTTAYTGKLQGVLKLSTVSTGKYIIPYFLKDFLSANEAVELVMDVTSKDKVLKSLQKNQVDFSLVSILPQDLEVGNEVLQENQLYLIGSGDYPTNQTMAEASMLEDQQLIFREQGSGTRSLMDAYLLENNIICRKKIVLTSNEAVKHAVIAGLGLSVMPLVSLKNELANGSLKIISLPNLPISSVWNLIWMKQKHFSPIAAAFLHHIQSQKSNINQNYFSWLKDYHG